MPRIRHVGENPSRVSSLLAGHTMAPDADPEEPPMLSMCFLSTLDAAARKSAGQFEFKIRQTFCSPPGIRKMFILLPGNQQINSKKLLGM